MANGILEVECPCCQATLRIDVETGAVLTHHAIEKPKQIEDIGLAVADLKVQAARREQVFEKSLADQKTRQTVLDRKFDELFRQASSEPVSKPFRPDFDLD